MNRRRSAKALAVVALGGLSAVGVSTSTSKAQTRQEAQEADLKAKVERLEKQVADLQKQVQALQPRLVVRSLPSPTQRGGNNVPPDWKSFPFNGQTYYVVPVEKGQPGIKITPVKP